MNTQYVFCKKEDWDRIILPDFEYEIWYYENYVKIETLGNLDNQNFPFYTFIGTVGDEMISIKMWDGNKFGSFYFSASMKWMSDFAFASYFGMAWNYIYALGFCDQEYHTCAMAYKSNRDFEKERLFDELFKQEVNEDDWK